MNSGQKIFFLILALILLMIICVYTHLQKVSVTQDIQTQTTTKSVDKNITKTIKQKKQLEETKEVDEAKETKKIKATEEKPQEKLEKKSEEKTEDEPLITTDKRYKRSGDEKLIEQMSIETQLLQIRIRDYVTKYPITFETSSNKVTNKSLNTISTVMKMLKNHPNLKIEIAGHTDASGTKKFNLGVSIGRAVAVKNQMIKYGFDKNMIKARGYGESIPIVENSKNGYSKVNRRVEFNIIEE